MMLFGFWEYKNCYFSDEFIKLVCDSIKVFVGGEIENVYIVRVDFVLDKNLFDFGVICRMYKGLLKRNGVSFDVVCKEYLV